MEDTDRTFFKAVTRARVYSTHRCVELRPMVPSQQERRVPSSPSTLVPLRGFLPGLYIRQPI